MTVPNVVLVPACITLGGVIVTVISNHLLARRRDSKARHAKAVDEFRAVIASLRAKLAAPPGGDDAFYQESLRLLAGAVEQFRPSATRYEWEGVSSTWHDYQAQEQQHLERHATKMEAAQIVGAWPRPDQILSSFLGLFERAVSGE